MDPLEIAQQLVSCRSETEESNADVSERMQSILASLGFDARALSYLDRNGTEKLALEAKRGPASSTTGTAAGIGYFCHNDVVSVDGWNCPHGGPFQASVAEGRLYGRGACDMKGSAAAALAALATIEPSRQTAPIYFFVTGDEECGMAGASLLANHSQFFSEMVAAGSVGIIGEPTELKLVNSHKGGCHVDVTSYGVAAHSSTAEGKNANWQMIPFLSFLHQLAQRCELEPALHNKDFSPATLSMNLVVDNQPAAANITVGKTTCQIFFRPMPETAWESVLSEILSKAQEMSLDARALPPLRPLFTPSDRSFVRQTLQILGQSQSQAVCYATDGCCFHQLQDLIVLGPGSIEQAHRPDEWISLDQLVQGTEIYAKLFAHFAGTR